MTKMFPRKRTFDAVEVEMSYINKGGVTLWVTDDDTTSYAELSIAEVKELRKALKNVITKQKED